MSPAWGMKPIRKTENVDVLHWSYPLIEENFPFRTDRRSIPASHMTSRSHCDSTLGGISKQYAYLSSTSADDCRVEPPARIHVDIISEVT